MFRQAEIKNPLLHSSVYIHHLGSESFEQIFGKHYPYLPLKLQSEYKHLITHYKKPYKKTTIST